MAGVLGLAAAFVSSLALAAEPNRPVYTIAIGHNGPHTALGPSQRPLPTLRYADDDALRFHALMRKASKAAYLLSVLDADTQRRFGGLANAARAPLLAELERVVELVRLAMEQDRAAGREPSLMFFFSGHGVREESGGAALPLLDGQITNQWLVERLLRRLPARFVHLIIDACHAEAFVAARDANAKLEVLSDAEMGRYFEPEMLVKFPHVGVVLASASGAQSFEWDAYRGGVFAHELLSGLRGAADVNADGRLDYGEMAAFVSAANQRVADPRARLLVVVRPPRVDRSAALLEHAELAGHFKLSGHADGAWARPFFIETALGERVLDAFPEKGTAIALVLPARERLYLVRKDGEIEISAREGSEVSLGVLRTRPPRTRARGALSVSLERGLFGTRFGPAFYAGFMSRSDEFVPVALRPEVEGEFRPADAPAPEASPARKTLQTALLIGSGVTAVATVAFAAAAVNAREEYNSTSLERDAAHAADQFHRYESLAWASGITSVTLGALGASLFFLPVESSSANRKGRNFPLSPTNVGFFAAGQF